MSRRLAQIELAVGILLLGAIVALVFIASVMRFAGYPLIWSVDMAQLLFIWLCFVGAGRAMRERAHLGVDLVVRRFGHDMRLAIETGLAILFVAFMIVLAWEGYKLTMLNRERIFGDSGISYAFVTIAVPAGFLFLSSLVAANAVDAWRRRRTDKVLIFSREADAGGVSEL